MLAHIFNKIFANQGIEPTGELSMRVVDRNRFTKSIYPFGKFPLRDLKLFFGKDEKISIRD